MNSSKAQSGRLRRPTSLVQPRSPLSGQSFEQEDVVKPRRVVEYGDGVVPRPRNAEEASSQREPQRAVLNRANDLNRVRHRHPYGDASMGLSIGEVGQDQRRAGRGIVHGGFDDGMGEFDEPHDTAHGDRSCPARC